MLKVRLMGTTNEIKWFKKMVERNKRIHLLNNSEILSIRNSKKFRRMYMEISKERPKGEDGGTTTWQK